MRYHSAGRNIVWEKFDDDSIVLDLNCGKYFSFSDSGNILWEALAQGADSDAIQTAGAGKAWASSFPDFVKELIGHQLIVPTNDNGTEIPAGLLALLANATEPPSVAVFDDLADLFMADPIHDVEEEAGWPVKKQT